VTLRPSIYSFFLHPSLNVVAEAEAVG
jgi:hypothetical protein